MVRRRVGVVLAVLATTTGMAACSSSGSAKKASAPNILFILTDDERWDSLGQFAFVNGRTDWTRFQNMFINDPQCCPSRSSILSGQDTRHTGVETLLQGKKFDESKTIATMLHDQGYRTALFGKYLNNYPFGRGTYIPPGWDGWHSFSGPAGYFDYKLNDQGKLVKFGTDPTDYSSDVFTRKAINFISRTPSDKPFFVYLAYFAPHREAAGDPTPAPRDKGKCKGQTFPHLPSYNQVDKVETVPWMSAAKPQSDADIARQMQATCETLHGVDTGVKQLFDLLSRTHRLDNTIVIFTSDNGYGFGEHRMTGKGDLYDESIRVPLLVRGPGITPHTTTDMTSNIDLAPTILDFAHVKAPSHFFDGVSFAPSAEGTGHTTRTEVLLRGCRTKRPKGGPVEEEDPSGALGNACGGYTEGMGKNWGLRTDRYKYVENTDGSRQLFDLVADPNELRNLAHDPKSASVVADFHSRLTKLERG